MRIIHDSYTPDGFWNLGYDEAPDWQQVQNDYDYVWAYNVSRFSGSLAAIGEQIFASGPLEVYRIRKTSDAPSDGPNRIQGQK